jgi:RimJ/RimL family protein N-acetyltransferase
MLLERDIHRVHHLFEAEHLALVLDAVIAGNTPAQVWTDDRTSPRTALIRDGAHSVYLGGAVDQPARWRELFDREIAAAKPGFLKLYVPEATARTVFGGYPLLPRQRVLYRRAPVPIQEPRPQVPAGFRISAIDERFDALAALDNFTAVLAEIESCWRSVDDFRRTGFGFVAHDATTIVCWCTAECVSDNRCGIGIETVEAYAGRGFATSTASAFVDNCVKLALTPYWDAWTTNLASVAVAERIGFTRTEAYSIFVMDLT